MYVQVYDVIPALVFRSSDRDRACKVNPSFFSRKSIIQKYHIHQCRFSVKHTVAERAAVPCQERKCLAARRCDDLRELQRCGRADEILSREVVAGRLVVDVVDLELEQLLALKVVADVECFGPLGIEVVPNCLRGAERRPPGVCRAAAEGWGVATAGGDSGGGGDAGRRGFRLCVGARTCRDRSASRRCTSGPTWRTCPCSAGRCTRWRARPPTWARPPAAARSRRRACR